MDEIDALFEASKSGLKLKRERENDSIKQKSKKKSQDMKTKTETKTETKSDSKSETISKSKSSKSPVVVIAPSLSKPSKASKTQSLDNDFFSSTSSKSQQNRTQQGLRLYTEEELGWHTQPLEDDSDPEGLKCPFDCRCCF